jgi:PAS domain S-box-containing protein
VAGIRTWATAFTAIGIFSCAAAAAEKTVLSIYPEARVPVVVAIDAGIRTTLQAPTDPPIHLLSEYLDLSWLSGSEPEELIGRLLREKYSAKVDLIIPCGEPAIRFMLRQRDRIFPGVPMVFCTADRETMREVPLPPDVTGVTMSLDWAGAADLALRLHPGTRRIVFISGAGPTGREWEDRARLALAPLYGTVEVRFLSGLPMADLLKIVAAEPAGTVGLLNAFNRDGTGRVFTTDEAAALISPAATFPLYSLSETLLGHGVVGGPAIDWSRQGSQAAGMALRILRGERLGPGEVWNRETNTYVFDDRQLRRWGIADQQLPPGSMVKFRESSIWETYRREIVAAVLFTGLQTVMILGLLYERRWRKRAEWRLDERLRFETLVSDLAAGFVEIRGSQVDQRITDGLRRVAEELALDRAALADFTPDGWFRVRHFWRRPGAQPSPDAVDAERMRWIAGRLRAGEIVSVSRVDDLPEAAASDRGMLDELGIRSVVMVPVQLEGAVAGVLFCTMLRAERAWPQELVGRLRLLGETFAMVLMRRRAQTALEESERRFRLMADAAPVMIWTAGPDGGCVDFNRAWLEFTGRPLALELGDGWAQGVHPDDFERCLRGYREALAARRAFAQEYRLRHADGAYRWVLCRGNPRFGANGEFLGYVGSDVDLTELRKTEEALARGREDLAHAQRVATLGELAATLAHEMNQPLAAILTNAQAGERLMQRQRLDRRQLAEPLQDIIGDARRAGEVVRRLRALFRKERPDRRPVDLNEAIGEVTGLLRKDLEWKGIALHLDLAQQLPPVLGDMVQLQQVILNVVLNACEAMNGASGGPREMRIETGRDEGQHVTLIFRDSGAGVKEGDLERIFDRFVSTKPDGLGMGLSISRSIIEAHGGRIWATRNEDRGLTIHGELPALIS